MTLGPTRRRRSRELRPLAGTSSSGPATCCQHQPRTSGRSSRRRRKARRQGRGDRPGAHRTARQADWHIPIRPGHRRGAGAGDDARDHRARAWSTPTTSTSTRSASTSWPSGSPSYTPEWVAARDRHRRPRTSSSWPGSTPPRRPSVIRIGVASSGTPAAADRARDRLPAGAGRCLAQCRRRRPAAADLGLPGELGRAERPDLHRRRRRGASTSGGSARRSPASSPGPPVKALFVYNSNPVVVAPEQASARAGSRARTCSPSSPSSS